MKLHALYLSMFVFSLISAVTAYAQDDTPSLGQGTVLTYNVKENRKSFNYTVTITKFNEQGDIAFDWRTDEVAARKGHSSMRYDNLKSATSFLLNIKNGDETLGKDESRIFLTEPMTQDISDHLAEFKIDGVTRNFIFVDMNVETKKVPVNNNTISLREHSGEDVTFYIGVIDMKNARVLGHYISLDLSIDLIAIDNKGMIAKTPVSNEKGQPRKMGSIDLIFAKVMWPTLTRVEEYDPTDGGRVKQPFQETYDYRLQSNGDLPPTYVDVFVVDLKYIYEHKAKFSKYITGDFTIGEKDFPDDEVMKVLNVYLNVNASELYGYRPWANQQFVKSLTEGERKKLAYEASSYVMMYGFKER